jgi:hypothetical protein
VAVSGGFARQPVAQHEKQITENLPRAVFVGVGKSRSCGRAVEPEMAEFAFAAGQPTADFPQRVGPPQLAEQHTDQLCPAAEAVRVTLSVAPFHN